MIKRIGYVLFLTAVWVAPNRLTLGNDAPPDLANLIIEANVEQLQNNSLIKNAILGKILQFDSGYNEKLNPGDDIQKITIVALVPSSQHDKFEFAMDIFFKEKVKADSWTKHLKVNEEGSSKLIDGKLCYKLSSLPIDAYFTQAAHCISVGTEAYIKRDRKTIVAQETYRHWKNLPNHAIKVSSAVELPVATIQSTVEQAMQNDYARAKEIAKTIEMLGSFSFSLDPSDETLAQLTFVPKNPETQSALRSQIDGLLFLARTEASQMLEQTVLVDESVNQSLANLVEQLRTSGNDTQTTITIVRPKSLSHSLTKLEELLTKSLDQPEASTNVEETSSVEQESFIFDLSTPD